MSAVRFFAKRRLGVFNLFDAAFILGVTPALSTVGPIWASIVLAVAAGLGGGAISLDLEQYARARAPQQPPGD